MAVKEYTPLLVSRVTDNLEPDKLYISLECNVVIHLCACGCGEKVVLPINPEGWKIIYDGESVTLHPSIGNFQFPCRSHYWIKHNKVVWADIPQVQTPAPNMTVPRKQSIWQIIKSKLKRFF